jgi:inactive STAND/Effector-associated domain 9
MEISDNSQDRINVVEQHINNLLADFSLATKQIDQTNDDVERQRLTRRAKSISDEMDEQEQELERLKKSKNSYKRSWDYYDDNLHHIDFDAAKKVTANLFKKYEKQECAALFFMHNSQEMGGRWYIKSMKSQLQNLPYSTWTEPFEYRSESHPGGDAAMFMSRLANKFISEIKAINEQDQIKKIVDAIYKSLPRGHVFFISISIEQVRPQDTFLEWFVNQFWTEIVRKLDEVKNSHPLIRIIGIISVEGKVDKKHTPSHLCTPFKQFDQYRMLELKLKPWTESQICTWLEAYSNIDPPDIPGKAQTIYQVTKRGVPLRVYDKLVTTIQIEAS